MDGSRNERARAPARAERIIKIKAPVSLPDVPSEFL